MITQFGKLELGEWYLRAGQSSTHAGVYNGAIACCNWDGEDKNRYDQYGNLVKLEEAQLTSTSSSLAEEGQRRKWFSVSSGCRATPARSWSIGREECGLYYVNSTNWVNPDGVEVWHCNGGLAMPIPDACREIEWKTAKWTAKDIQLGCLLSSVPDIKGLCFALWLVLLNAIVSHGPWSVF